MQALQWHWAGTEVMPDPAYSPAPYLSQPGPAPRSRFAAQLIATSAAEEPTAAERLACARVALRQALSTDDIEAARAWIESALRQIEEAR